MSEVRALHDSIVQSHLYWVEGYGLGCIGFVTHSPKSRQFSSPIRPVQWPQLLSSLHAERHPSSIGSCKNWSHPCHLSKLARGISGFRSAGFRVVRSALGLWHPALRRPWGSQNRVLATQHLQLLHQQFTVDQLYLCLCLLETASQAAGETASRTRGPQR